MHNLSKHIGGYKVHFRLTCGFFCWIFCLVFFYYGLIFGLSDDEKDIDASDDENRKREGKKVELTGLLTLIYILCLLGSICGFVCYSIRFQKARRAKIDAFFNAINHSSYNPRGIHWVMMWAPKLQYINIMFMPVNMMMQ